MYCIIEDCGRIAKTRKMCTVHYTRALESPGNMDLRPILPRPKTPKRPCSVDSCDKPAKGASMCSMHYTRMQRHASLEAPIARHPDPFVRFASRLEPAGDCWQWTGHASKDGYPYFVLAQALQVRAHRWALEHIGETEIPEGYEVDHICHNTLCCRPGHLQALTTDEHIELGRKRRELRAGTGLEWTAPSKHRSMREIYFGLEHKLPTALSFHQ